MSIGDTDFGVQVGIGVLGRVATALVALAGSIFLARILGPVGYGSFYLLLAVVRFLDNPVTGWSTACRKRLTEADFPSREALGSLVAAVLVSSAVVTVLAYLLRDPLAGFIGEDGAWALLSVLFFGIVAYKPTLEMLQATANFGASTWTLAARDVLRVAAQAGLVVAGFGVAGMVGGMVLANLVMIPVLAYFIGVRPTVPSRRTFQRIWEFARSSIPNGVLSTAQDRMDVLLLGFLATQSVVGNYEVALRMTVPAIFISGVASSGLMGRVSNRRSKDQSVIDDIRNNLSFASLLAVPIFFGSLVVGGPVVVTIYSNQFEQAGTFIAGLALYHLFVSQKDILAAVIDGHDRPGLNLRVSAVSFVFNLALGVSLFFLVGPIGVIIATVLSAVLAYVARAYLVRSLLPAVSVVPRPLLDQLVSGIIMAASVFAARSALSLGWWGNVVLVVTIGGVVYFGVLVAISEPFRGTARAIARDVGLG